MGSVNCCKKPDDAAEISSSQNNAQGQEGGEEVHALERDNSYPHDSEQIYKNQGKADLSPNQKIYSEECQNSKDGNTYEVAVDVQNPNENQQNNEQNDQNLELENNEPNKEAQLIQES